MSARVALVLGTACLSGLMVGSGVAQLIAPELRFDRPEPLPRVDVAEPPAADLLAGGLFAPIDDPPPPPPGGPEGPTECQVPWRLVGTMLDRRSPDRSFAAVHTPEGSRLIAMSMTHEELTLVSLDAEAVTLERGDGRRCEIRMFTRETTTEVIAALPEVPAPPEHPQVRRLSASHVEIDRGLLGATGDLRVRAIPHVVEGQVRGVRLYGVRRGSPLAAAGVQNGDLVSAVDGAPITGPDVAFGALGRLQSGAPVRVTVETRGRSREVTVSLRD